MNSQAQALIDVAIEEVGYLEKASNSQLDAKTANAGKANWTKYGAWYGQGLNGYAWCAMFVSWCANQAGISTDIIPKFHSCTSGGVSFFKEVGRWYPRYEYTPEPGDIIFFTNNNGASAAHVGIVYAVEGGRVYTVEGNTSGGSTLIANGGGVAKKSYSLTYGSIYGYGHPDYIEEEDDEMVRYEKLTDVPEKNNFQAIIEDLMDAGIVNGDGSDADGNDDVIDLSHDMVRMFIFEYRGGLYDEELEAAGIDPDKYK